MEYILVLSSFSFCAFTGSVFCGTPLCLYLHTLPFYPTMVVFGFYVPAGGPFVVATAPVAVSTAATPSFVSDFTRAGLMYLALPFWCRPISSTLFEFLRIPIRHLHSQGRLQRFLKVQIQFGE